jgi:hypothetical protein
MIKQGDQVWNCRGGVRVKGGKSADGVVVIIQCGREAERDLRVSGEKSKSVLLETGVSAARHFKQGREGICSDAAQGFR